MIIVHSLQYIRNCTFLFITATQNTEICCITSVIWNCFPKSDHILSSSLVYYSLACSFLVEGFRHCSVEDAPSHKEPAEKLLIATIQDGSHFVMDYLLELQPIRALEGTTLYNVMYQLCCMYVMCYYFSCYRS